MINSLISLLDSGSPYLFFRAIFLVFKPFNPRAVGKCSKTQIILLEILNRRRRRRWQQEIIAQISRSCLLWSKGEKPRPISGLPKGEQNIFCITRLGLPCTLMKENVMVFLHNLNILDFLKMKLGAPLVVSRHSAAMNGFRRSVIEIGETLECKVGPRLQLRLWKEGENIYEFALGKSLGKIMTGMAAADQPPRTQSQI